MVKKSTLRGFPLPLEPYTTETVCVKFKIPDTDEYRLATIGAVQELAKWSSWQQDPEQKARIASQLFKNTLLEMFEFTVCDDGGEPVDMPIDYTQIGCKLFYSTDNKVSWQLMFDYEECFNSLLAGTTSDVADTIIINGASTEELERLLQEYLNGNRPDDGVLDPIYWDVATCLATYSIINALVNGLLARRQQADNFDLIGLIVGGVVGGVGFLDVVFKAITWKLTVAVGMLATAFAFFQYITRDEIVSIPEAEFTDPALLDELRVNMYQSMKGIAPSLSSWEEALDGVTAVTPNTIKIRNWIKDGLTLESFVAYLQMTRILYDFAKAEDFQENACEQIAVCEEQIITWLTYGETPPEFVGYAQYAGQTFPLTRAPNTRWTSGTPSGGNNIIVDYTVPAGCNISGFNFNAVRATGNGFQMLIYIQTEEAPLWTLKASRNTGNIGVDNMLEWVNSNYENVTKVRAQVNHIATFYITRHHMVYLKKLRVAQGRPL